MNVYTYFESVPELPQEDELQLIELWKQSWAANGWNPVVLEPCKDEDDGFKYYYRRLESYPNVNAKKYEMACMLRWWALRKAGGGLMVDYDVMNYGFRPEHLENEFTVFNLGACPCAVYADVDACSRVINTIYTFDTRLAAEHNGKKYIHDQVVFQAKPDRLQFKAKDLCCEPNRTNWQKYPMVHFNNDSMYKLGKRPRWKFIDPLVPRIK